MASIDLQRQILLAFASVPRPARDQIASHFCPECEELAEDLAPFKSTELPEEVLQKHVWDMSLLSADAKHYYMPAWLLQGLDASGPWLNDAASVILGTLANTENRWSPTKPYSAEQWIAVRDWLSHIEKIADEVDREQIEAARRRVANEL